MLLMQTMRVPYPMRLSLSLALFGSEVLLRPFYADGQKVRRSGVIVQELEYTCLPEGSISDIVMARGRD